MTNTLGIIAGLGDLPVKLASEARSQGRDIYILRIDGFVEPKLKDYPGEVVGIGQVGQQIKLLKKANCDEIVFAGIVKRPDFSKIKLDLKGASLLPKVIAAARKGDDALLRCLIETFEKEGFSIIGAETVNEQLVAPLGVICGPQPRDDLLSDLKRAAYIASVMGQEDIGQACVVHDGLVIAVEAQEGTDEMLKRVQHLKRPNRGGVLVKRPKPIQERRIDLPTIGVSTIEAAAAAGLTAIGLESNGALILDVEACKNCAETHKILLYGFPQHWDNV